MVRKKFMAVGKAYKTVFWPSPGLTRRTFDKSGFSEVGTFISVSAVPHCWNQGKSRSSDLSSALSHITKVCKMYQQNKKYFNTQDNALLFMTWKSTSVFATFLCAEKTDKQWIIGYTPGSLCIQQSRGGVEFDGISEQLYRIFQAIWADTDKYIHYPLCIWEQSFTIATH